jgi:hypothetical protein
MDHAFQRLVRQRAQNRCEYCQLPQAYSTVTFEIDHILARKHGGRTTPANLALSCFFCNNRKGTDISGIDRLTKKITELFNPRRHKWQRHVRWHGSYLVGRTAIRRVTIRLLDINASDRIQLRQSLIDEGVFPPP